MTRHFPFIFSKTPRHQRVNFNRKMILLIIITIARFALPRDIHFFRFVMTNEIYTFCIVTMTRAKWTPSCVEQKEEKLRWCKDFISCITLSSSVQISTGYKIFVSSQWLAKKSISYTVPLIAWTRKEHIAYDKAFFVFLLRSVLCITMSILFYSRWRSKKFSSLYKQWYRYTFFIKHKTIKCKLTNFQLHASIFCF
jgi:hypothetical protein